MALSSVVTSTLSFGMGEALDGSSDSMKLLVKTLMESPLSTLISAGIQGKDIKLKDITMGMIEKFATTLAQQEVDKGKREREMKERQNSLPPGGDFDGMLGLQFGGMFAAAARRESADPGDAAAQSSGTGDSAGVATTDNDILSMVGTSDNLLIDPGMYPNIAGMTAIPNQIESQFDSPVNAQSLEPMNLPATENLQDIPIFSDGYDNIASQTEQQVIVETPYLSPSDVESVFTSDYSEDSVYDPFNTTGMFSSEYDTGYNGDINPDSFAAKIPQWQFVDNSVANNQGTANIIKEHYKSLYGQYPSTEVLAQLVSAAVDMAHYDNAGNYGGANWAGYQNMCKEVVNLFSTQPVTSAETVATAGTETRPSEQNQTTPCTNQVQPPQQNNPKPPFDTSTDSFSSEALKKATAKINTLTEKSLTELSKKYKTQIDAANKPWGSRVFTETEKQTKALFITLVNELKNIVNDTKKNMTADDKKKLITAVSKKITKLMANKIGYTDGNDFFDNTGTFLRYGLEFACTNYTTLIAHIMGATKSSPPLNGAGNNAWYYYEDYYTYTEEFTNNAKFTINSNGSVRPWVDGEIGTTVLANNTSVLTKDTAIDKTKIVEWLNNPTKYKDNLESLKGTVFMFKRGVNTKLYDTYEHTGMIVDYRIDSKTGKAVLITNDSTSGAARIPKIDSPNGIGTTQYGLDYIPNWSSFDIYNIKC